MKQRLIIIMAAAAVACASAGCSYPAVTAADPSAGTYSTQTSMTTADYGVFMAKQATTFLNQLVTHISIIFNSDTGMYENEKELAEASLVIMRDAYDNTVVTMPAEPYSDDREGMLGAMETAIGHMESYIGALEEKADVSRYQTDFKNDMTAITAYVNLYYR